MNQIDRVIRFYHWCLKLLSRSEWSVRLLNLPRCVGMDAEPGLVMIQIDGLAYEQFRHALSRGRLPFIRKLIFKEGFTAKQFYSGLPSSTPAVQGELFYGAKTAVPAFEFIDRGTGKRHAMFRPSSANEMARQLRQKGEPLLESGVAYSHIYSGGARAARYCAETMNLQSLLMAANPLKLIFILLFHIGKLFRIIGYAFVELILAVHDFFRGIFSGKNILKELTFIPTRLFICAILRELIRFRVKMDVTRGIPIVSANLIGYDEQAHRRGPGSKFAYWTLKGIDGVIKDVYQTALRSECRDYQIVIYSDHGQELVESYTDRFGKPVKQAVRELYHKTISSEYVLPNPKEDQALEHLYRRAGNLLFGKRLRIGEKKKAFFGTFSGDVEITTMGPLGHVYLPKTVRELSNRNPKAFDLEEFACTLSQQAHIPLVLFQQKKKGFAVHEARVYALWDHRALILGYDHPFLDSVAEDLEQLCLHPNSGDLIISGWNPEADSLSFNIENGAHGGPGKEETRGVVVLPPSMENEDAWLRPLDLRRQIMDYSGRE